MSSRKQRKWMFCTISCLKCTRLTWLSLELRLLLVWVKTMVKMRKTKKVRSKLSKEMVGEKSSAANSRVPLGWQLLYAASNKPVA